MHVYCDESGNTGVDLLNRDQPVFALASTSMPVDIATRLLAPLMRPGQSEVKYQKLRGTRPGQKALREFLSAPELQVATTRFTMADKRYYLVSHIVDKLIEPCVRECGVDLYANDAHFSLTNLWYYTGHYIFPNGHWETVLQAFAQAVRRRDEQAFARFDEVLTHAFSAASSNTRDFAAGIFISRGRLPQFIGVYRDAEVFDPACDCFISMMQCWMKDISGSFVVTHDHSKPLRRNEQFLRALMKPAAGRTIGYGERKCELPLRVSRLTFGDSQLHPQLQIADVIAGAAIDCLLAWSNKRPTSDFHESLKESRLSDLFTGGMLPSLTLHGTPDPAPGERSLVDGATDYLEEVGYFDKIKAAKM